MRTPTLAALLVGLTLACSSPTEPRPTGDPLRALICADSVAASLRPDCTPTDTATVVITIQNPNPGATS